jgi:transcriptional regulator with XRE-family HTH domain
MDDTRDKSYSQCMSDSQGQRVTDTVAGEIRAHLARRRISGRQVAAQLGWSQPSTSRRLAGLTPLNVEELAQLAGLLDVPVESFFAGPEVKKVTR